MCFISKNGVNKYRLLYITPGWMLSATAPTHCRKHRAAVYLEQRSAHYHNAAFVTLCWRERVSSHCRGFIFPHRSLPLFSCHISSLISLLQLAVKVFFNKMIGQKSIHSFFSPVSKKRISAELNDSEEDAQDSVSVTSVSNTLSANSRQR